MNSADFEWHYKELEERLAPLEAENKRLRAALEQIARFAKANGMQDWKMTKIARKALEK